MMDQYSCIDEEKENLKLRIGVYILEIYKHINKIYFNAEDIPFDEQLVNEVLIDLRDSNRIIEYGSYYFIESEDKLCVNVLKI